VHVYVRGNRYKICYSWAGLKQLDVNILITWYESIEKRETSIHVDMVVYRNIGLLLRIFYLKTIHQCPCSLPALLTINFHYQAYLPPKISPKIDLDRVLTSATMSIVHGKRCLKDFYTTYFRN